ncbi:hypothetical protein ANN_05748 [Periplaneta americana]|uniref:Uncharacterized protein n=1 Tax=Periplaneta americana TaxID=6978 RepID=A0ABQ8TDG7_PERAM|nr:hypothetical protein ANN_05748 [Periplaneta americana]
MAGLCEGGNEPPGSLKASDVRSVTQYCDAANYPTGGSSLIDLISSSVSLFSRDNGLGCRDLKLTNVGSLS